MNAKRNMILNLICAALFFINAFLRVNNSTTAVVLWSIGGIFWVIIGYTNYKLYKRGDK